MRCIALCTQMVGALEDEGQPAIFFFRFPLLFHRFRLRFWIFYNSVPVFNLGLLLKILNLLLKVDILISVPFEFHLFFSFSIQIVANNFLEIDSNSWKSGFKPLHSGEHLLAHLTDCHWLPASRLYIYLLGREINENV